MTNCSNLKNIALAVFILVQASLSAQEQYAVNVLPSRLNLSFENLEMQNEEDLGFLGIGYEILEITSKFKSLYVGLHSYSAITGERPGLITLGMTAGLRFSVLKKNKLYIDGGFFLGGGGGGNAADGGGLIIRPHIAIEKQFGILGLRLGYSQINFPTGEIKGNQLNVGLTFNNLSYFNTNTNTSNGAKLYRGLAFKNLRFALVGTSYFNLSKESSSRSGREDQSIGLIGAQLEYGLNDYWYAMAKINGALIGEADGYMSIFLGFGAELPLIKNTLKIEPRVLFGPTGGGNLESGGGATVQYEIGPAMYFKNGFYLKGNIGKTQSPWGDLNTNHLEFVIGKSLARLDPVLGEGQTEFNVSKSEVRNNHMSFSISNRTYFTPDALDKRGIPYLSSFNLLAFEGQQFIGDRFSVNAATVWAYEGDYGAYAEGLVGAGYKFPIVNKLNLNTKVLMGAAGGGSINLGSGLIFQYFGGLQYSITKNSMLFVNIGKFEPLSGNFDPVIIDAGIKLHLFQLFKKNN